MTHPNGILPDVGAVVMIAVKYPDAAIDRWCKQRPDPVTREAFLEAMGRRDPFQATCAWGTTSCGRCLHVCHSHEIGRKTANDSEDADTP